MQRKPVRPWPTGSDCGVSLTFDDGSKSQLERAIPYMNKVGVRGTFYLNPRENFQEQLKPWTEAAAAGHEIGNHTVTHPCARSLTGSERGLEAMTLADLEADILEAERRLRAAIPGQTRRSFCYPCYYHHVGEGLNRQSYVPIIAKHFTAGRTGTCNRGFFPDPTYCDLHCLESHACETLMGYEMIGLCERAANQGRWCILTFHGIHEGHLSVSDGDFRELCDHLVRHKNRFHVAPVTEIAERIAQLR
jgi:hypothetical protein